MKNNSNPLLAFHGDQSIKSKYLDRVRMHREADEIISGKYWEDGKGCAVGCCIHSSNHSAYETELGIPTILARLEDRIFEGLYKKTPTKAKDWPERFLSAAKPGADLSVVWPKFALWLLIDPKHGVINFTKRERSIAAIKAVGALYQRWVDGDKPSAKEWNAAAYAAYAAYAADAAAAYAAYAAYAAADAYAYAAADAYAAAAADAYAADAAYAAADARSKCYSAMADKLISLMEDAGTASSPKSVRQHQPATPKS